MSVKAGLYTHAQQFKRMKRAIKPKRTIMGRLHREIDRKPNTIAAAERQTFQEILNKAACIVAQSGRRKSVSGQPKLYSPHAPKVDCLSKDRAKHPYECGVKVGIASTHKGNLIVGALALHGNPYGASF